MIGALLRYFGILVRTIPALFRDRSSQAVVELALRQQLAIYAHRNFRPRLSRFDRAFWVVLFRFWSRWKEVLIVVQPETVVRWHREGFRLYWRWISKANPGRPRVDLEIRMLIQQMAKENGWRAKRIHAELEKLGFEVSIATVARYLPPAGPVDGKHQPWATFLRNHRDAIAAMDFLVVPTVRFKLLYVWFAIDHARREVLHFNVTANPTSAWVIQQLRETFPGDSSIRFLIHDNDAIFSRSLRDSIPQLGIESRPTSIASPWQNGLAERWVGTVRRELLDHVIVLDERHLYRLMREYVDYYNRDRVHTGRRAAPMGRDVEIRPKSGGQIVSLPRVGGLHHRYTWAAAA